MAVDTGESAHTFAGVDIQVHDDVADQSVLGMDGPSHVFTGVSEPAQPSAAAIKSPRSTGPGRASLQEDSSLPVSQAPLPTLLEVVRDLDGVNDDDIILPTMAGDEVGVPQAKIPHAAPHVDDLPCIILASHELNAMRFNQRRHVRSVQENKIRVSKGRNLHKNSDVPLPSGQSYPPDCLQILRLLDGNGACVDCGAGKEPPMWASIANGTLLCDKCAFIHITRSEEKQFQYISVVKHLVTGYWSLPEVFTMLEGGNGNFVQAVGKFGMRMRERTRSSKPENRVALRSSTTYEKVPGSQAFDARYESKAALAYCAIIKSRVGNVSSAFDCELPYPLDFSRDREVAKFNTSRPIPVDVVLRENPANDGRRRLARSAVHRQPTASVVSSSVGSKVSSTHGGSRSGILPSISENSSESSMSRRSSNES